MLQKNKLCSINNLSALLAGNVEIEVNDFDCGDKFLNDFAKKKLISYERADYHKAFVAVDDGKLKGYATISAKHLVSSDFGEELLPLSSPKNVPVIMLEQIAVDAQSQGQGIGRRLMKRILKSAFIASASIGTKGVALWSHPDALKFYRSIGFKELQSERKGNLTLTLMFLPIEMLRGWYSPTST